MICSKCNQVIPDGVYYCEHCGNATDSAYTQQPFNSDGNNQNQQQYNRQNYAQNNPQYAPYSQAYTPQAYEYMIETKIEEARTLGIISLIAGFFLPIIGIVLGIIGITKLNDIPLSMQFRFESELKRKKAKQLCIAGIAVPISLWTLAVIFYVLIFVIFFGAMSSYYY